MCVYVTVRRLRVNSGQWTVVRPVAVWSRVWARRVGQDAPRGDDDRPPLFLLAHAPFALGALDVLDCLQRQGKGDEWCQGQQHPLVLGSESLPSQGRFKSLPFGDSYLNDSVQVLSRCGHCIDNWCRAHGYHGDMMGRLGRCRDDDRGVVCRCRGGRRGQNLE